MQTNKKKTLMELLLIRCPISSKRTPMEATKSNNLLYGNPCPDVRQPGRVVLVG